MSLGFSSSVLQQPDDFDFHKELRTGEPPSIVERAGTRDVVIAVPEGTRDSGPT